MFAPDTTVQLPTVATPSAPVNAGEPVTLPPLGAKSTWALGTARFDESSTSTAGLTFSAEPARPPRVFPPLRAPVPGGPTPPPPAVDGYPNAAPATPPARALCTALPPTLPPTHRL